MKLQKPRCGWFASHRARALDYQLERYHDKVVECSQVKKENIALRETVVAQRIALDALNEAHRQDSKIMEEQMATLQRQVSAITAERDRYRSALRRSFPASSQEALV